MSEVFEHIPLNDINYFLDSLYKISSNKTKIYLTTPNRIVQGSAYNSSSGTKLNLMVTTSIILI